MPRARDLDIEIGMLPTGPTNSVLDVAGVGLGHATIHRDEPLVARTGVTCLVLAEDAYRRPVPAGGAVIVDFKLDVPGHYTIVDHALSRAERGLAGTLIVEGDPRPEIFDGKIPEGLSGH